MAVEFDWAGDEMAPLSWAIDADSVALAALVPLGLDCAPIIPPEVFVRAVGLRGRGRACSGCDGLVDIVNGVIRVNLRGPPAAVSKRVSHELGHVLLCWGGIPAPHHEEHVDDIGERLWVRPWAVRRAIERAEWDASGLITLFADQVPALTLFRIVAVELGAIVIARLRRRRWVFAPDGYEVPLHAHEWEKDWVRDFERKGIARPEVSSIRLSRFVDPAGGDGVAIMVPAEAAEYMARSPWKWGE